MEDYRKHPERTFLGPDGEQCSYETKGWMSRMIVMSSETVMTGKEGTRIGKDTENEGRQWEDVHKVYGRVGDRLPDAVEVLRELPQKEVAAALGVNERKVRNWISGKTKPAYPEKVIVYAATKAAEVAARLGIEGGDPFESYRRAKEQARARITTLPKSVLKAAGFSGSDVALIGSVTYIPSLRRFLKVLPELRVEESRVGEDCLRSWI